MLRKNFNLDNKVIIITGGAGLLGKRFAEVIAESNGIPIILDLNIKKSKSIIMNIKNKFGINAKCYKCDITDQRQVYNVLKSLNKLFKRKLFGLINNAAFNPQASKNVKNELENFNLKTWEKELKIGLTGAFVCTKIFGSQFAKNGNGSIINVSSDLGVNGPKQSLYSHLNYIKPVTYSVVKHGIIGLTKYSCTYWGKKGVRSNTIAPGGVYNNQDQSFIKKLKKEIPSNRMANINDFDGIIIYLLSDLSKYCNGSFISVDGGRTVF